MMFPEPFAGQLNDIYFAYSNFLEFFVFIFIRTRSSIKFYAKFISIINVMFLFYINSYMYSAQTAFMSMLFFLTVAISFAFLEMFEVPSIQDWNPFHESTPFHPHRQIGRAS